MPLPLRSKSLDSLPLMVNKYRSDVVNNIEQRPKRRKPRNTVLHRELNGLGSDGDDSDESSPKTSSSDLKNFSNNHHRGVASSAIEGRSNSNSNSSSSTSSADKYRSKSLDSFDIQMSKKKQNWRRQRALEKQIQMMHIDSLDVSVKDYKERYDSNLEIKPKSNTTADDNNTDDNKCNSGSSFHKFDQIVAALPQRSSGTFPPPSTFKKCQSWAIQHRDSAEKDLTRNWQTTGRSSNNSNSTASEKKKTNVNATFDCKSISAFDRKKQQQRKNGKIINSKNIDVKKLLTIREGGIILNQTTGLTSKKKGVIKSHSIVQYAYEHNNSNMAAAGSVVGFITKY